MKKVFLIVSIISILFLVGCNKNVSENDKNQIQHGEISSSVDSGNIEKVVKKIDENKDIVYDAFVKELEDHIFILESDLEEGPSFLWKFPYINIDSKEVEEINNRISTYIEDAKKMEETIDADYPSYYVSINDNILTVALGTRPGAGIQFYGEVCFLLVDEVYNIDIYTGELLNTEEVLKTTNDISVNDIDLKEIYDEMFIDAREDYLKDEFRENSELLVANEEYKKYVDYYTNKTIEDIPWFIDDNKNIIAEMYWYTSTGATDGSRMIEQVNITEIINGKGNNYYIIEDSDKKVLEESEWSKGHYPELVGFSNSELNIAYNEIFARHGHDFASKELKEHFSNMLWYKPIDGKQVTIEELNDVEKENIRIIKEEIDERKVLLERYKNGEM